MDPAAVWMEPGGGPRLLAGLLLFLLPGIAAADRWMPGPARWLWAPVWSATLLAVWAVALDFALAIAIGARNTALLALLLAAWIGRRRLLQAGRALRRGAARAARERRLPALRLPRPRLGPLLLALAVLATMAFVAFVQYLPHIPAGPEPDDPLRRLAYRAWDAANGRDDPYPLHVDEHNHMAHMAQVVREGRSDTDHPLSGDAPQGSMFSVSGLRRERGFDVAIAQLHLLTGLSLPALFRVLPAAWAGYLALCAYLALRPAPGALASAAFVAALHTTDRFLGPGFLVPSAFALPWLLAVVHAATRGQGPPRLAALWWLATGAFAMHIVFGTLALAAGVVAALAAEGRWWSRAALAAAVLLPLAWIVPLAYPDIAAAVGSEHTLPFDTGFFTALGWVLPLLAVAGAGVAWYRRPLPAATAPHRVLAFLACAMAASMVLSIRTGHHNDATYSRLVHAFFLCLGALAGLACGALARLARSAAARAASRRRRAAAAPRPGLPAAAGAALAVLLVAAGLARPIEAHLEEPLYRIFDDDSWAAGAALARAPDRPGTFLSDPWKAPVYNALSGERPWTYLLPGAPPVNGADYAHYLRTAGANETWLQQRSVEYVVHAVPPKAPHDTPAPGLHALRRAAASTTSA